eukprot:s837_g27.t1
MRLEVVNGETPFLLSNAFLKATAADVCSTESALYFRNLGVSVPLQMNSKGLYTVELAEVLKAVSDMSEPVQFNVPEHVKLSQMSFQRIRNQVVKSTAKACLQPTAELIVLANQQLTWPNIPNPKAIVRFIIDLPVNLMASVPTVSYVTKSGKVPLPDAELTLSVDPSLAYENPVQEVIHRPPGVVTLRQWGNQVFPEGKHMGATFIAVYNKDPKYMAYMKGHSHLTSPCMGKELPELCQGSVSTINGNGEFANSMCHSERKCQSFHQRVGSPEQSGTESGSNHSEQGQAWHVGGREGGRDREDGLMSRIAILQRELDRMKDNQ